MNARTVFRSAIDYRVIFGDTDAGGIVYHPRYLELAERGRNELMRELGLDIGALFNQSNVGLALRSADLKFHSPAIFDDNLTVSTSLARLNSASSVWVSHIRRGGTDICTVRADILCMDRIKKKPIIYPDEVLQAFKKMQIAGNAQREKD